ncbi:MAG: BatA domain-containing protein [Planctomycetes bacterium]|nr:BatA domain-containing protein [Planctomycetota bacterium]
MDFANPALLGWTALAGVPVLIHLLARPRPQRIPFAAVRFLRVTQEKARRVYRLKNFLLLALRMLVLSLFVLSVARPIAHQAAGLADEAAFGASVAVIVDDTLGMRWKDRYDLARSEAARILTRQPPGTQAAVFFASGDRTAFLLDHAGLEQEVLRSPCSARWADLTGCLVRVLGEATRREVSAVYVVTDLAASKWPALAKDALLAGGPGLPPISVVDVGDRDAANDSVQDVRLDAEEPRAGQRVEVRARIRAGPRARRRNVELWVGSERREERRLDLAADRDVEVRLAFEAPAPGAYGGSVRLAPSSDDGLDLDDARYFAVNVPEPLPVLLVCGAPEGKDAELYLSTALAPPGLGTRQRFRVTRARPDELAKRSLAPYRAIVVACLTGAAFDPPLWKALGDYLEEGGGVALFQGPVLKAESFAGQEAERVLPVLPGASVDSPEGASLDLVEARHRVLAPFVTGWGGALASARFLTTIGSSPLRAAGSSTVLARFPGLAPALVERSVGAGRVTWFGGLLAPAASDFARSPAFAPFLHALVSYLSGETRSPRDVRPGEVLRGIAEAQAVGGRAEWLVPWDKAPIQSRIDGRSREFALAETDVPGIYEARYALGQKVGRAAFAVNVDPRGSDLHALTLEELAARLPGLTLRRESASLLAPLAGGGAADWVPAALLVLVVVLMGCESWLAART